MRRELATGLVIAAGASALFAAAALSAPVSAKPPSISGTPAFNSVLTCNKGSWSSDAVSFDYAWFYSGGPQIASGQKWRVAMPLVGYNVVCQVTAHDAQGAITSATSPPVLITPGIPTVKITKVTTRHRSIEISGIAGPAAARARSSTSKPTMVLDRVINKKTVTQIAGRLILQANGHFSIGGKDTPGRHTYIVIFVPAPVSGYAFFRLPRPNVRIPH